MKLFSKGKDGGPKSTVTGYWLIELKSCFSIVLLKFEGYSREAYHTHAFNAISWVLSGALHESTLPKGARLIRNSYFPSFRPVYTSRDTNHKVDAKNPTWVLSFRGPWSKTWKEYSPISGKTVTLTDGRQEV